MGCGSAGVGCSAVTGADPFAAGGPVGAAVDCATLDALYAAHCADMSWHPASDPASSTVRPRQTATLAPRLDRARMTPSFGGGGGAPLPRTLAGQIARRMRRDRPDPPRSARGEQDRTVTSEVVALGGSVESGSQSDRAMRAVVSTLTERGVGVRVFAARVLDFPPYHPGAPLTAQAREFVAAVRAADAVVIASPGYHGIVSGLVKNALDYLEELRSDERPYLHGRPVGLVAVAGGWQAAVGTLGSLRQVVHALRGWPTPLGLAINSRVTAFDDEGHTGDEHVAASIPVLCDQLLMFKAG